MLKLIASIALLLAFTLAGPVHSQATDTLKITHSSSMPPLSFINDDGEPDGILIDLWKEWSEHSGIPVKFELKDWKTAVEETTSGKADINAGLFYSEKRSHTLVFGDFLFHLRGAMFAAKGLVKDNKVNMENNICGVLKGGYSKTFMEKNHPFTPLMLFNSIGEMFRTVAKGRLKLFVADYPVALYQLHQHGLDDSFELVRHMYTRELYPAVSKSNKDLISIVNINMAAIPKNNKNSIIRKWLDRQQEWHLGKELIVWMSAIMFLGIVLYHRSELKALLRIFKREET